MQDNNLKTARPPSERVKFFIETNFKTVRPRSGRESQTGKLLPDSSQELFQHVIPDNSAARRTRVMAIINAAVRSETFCC